MTIAVTVITTYNEAPSLGALVTAMRQYGDVIVIDDQSTDETMSLATVAGALVYSTLQRSGIGQSLMTGWRYALDYGAQRIIQIDAGGSHCPQDAKEMIVASDHFDVVVGSRFCRGACYINKGRRLRPLASRAMALTCNLFDGRTAHDWTSGYRIFTADAVQRLLQYRYYARMHGWQIETLHRARQERMSIGEIPITYIAGRSSFNGKVALEASNVVLQMFFHGTPSLEQRAQWKQS